MSFENVLSFYETMTEAVTKLRESLAEEGVSQSIIDKVVGNPPEGSGENLAETYGRLISPNSGATNTKANYTDSSAAKADATSVTKQSWIGKSDVVIITDYTAKEHAIFGDFVKAYVQFKDKYLKVNGWFQYHAKLAFGAGWRMLDKTKLPDLRKALKAAKIPFREVTRDEFTNEITAKNSPADVAEISGDDGEQVEKTTAKKVTAKQSTKVETKKTETPAPSSKKITKPSAKVEPEKKAAPKEEPKSKPKILKNSYGNFEEEGTGLVFMKLPVGAGGKPLNVCVGYQFPSTQKGEKGHETIYALTEEHIEAAAQNSHKILDDEMIEKIRDTNPELAEKLEDITIRGIEGLDDELGEEEDVDNELDEDEEEDEDDA